MYLTFFSSLSRHRFLLWRLAQREVLGRYRGSIVGIGWSLLNPLAMLAVYTFVFSQVFKARWGSGVEHSGPLSFAVNLFAGLIVFNFLSECVSRAPNLIIANPNYVKKVVFPLEVLGASLVGSSAFHALISLVVLLGFRWFAFQGLPYTVIYLPLIWLPLILGSLSLTWLLSASGVFLRDIGQIVNVLLNVLLYLSPIFYPISSLPQQWHIILHLNPLTPIIEETRKVIVVGSQPQIAYLILWSMLALILTEVSFRLFKKSKRAFADVI